MLKIMGGERNQGATPAVSPSAVAAVNAGFVATASKRNQTLPAPQAVGAGPLIHCFLSTMTIISKAAVKTTIVDGARMGSICASGTMPPYSRNSPENIVSAPA